MANITIYCSKTTTSVVDDELYIYWLVNNEGLAIAQCMDHSGHYSKATLFTEEAIEHLKSRGPKLPFLSINGFAVLAMPLNEVESRFPITYAISRARFRSLPFFSKLTIEHVNDIFRQATATLVQSDPASNEISLAAAEKTLLDLTGDEDVPAQPSTNTVRFLAGSPLPFLKVTRQSLLASPPSMVPSVSDDTEEDNSEEEKSAPRSRAKRAAPNAEHASQPRRKRQEIDADNRARKNLVKNVHLMLSTVFETMYLNARFAAVSESEIATGLAMLWHYCDRPLPKERLTSIRPAQQSLIASSHCLMQGLIPESLLPMLSSMVGKVSREDIRWIFRRCIYIKTLAANLHYHECAPAADDNPILQHMYLVIKNMLATDVSFTDMVAFLGLRREEKVQSDFHKTYPFLLQWENGHIEASTQLLSPKSQPTDCCCFFYRAVMLALYQNAPKLDVEMQEAPSPVRTSPGR